MSRTRRFCNRSCTQCYLREATRMVILICLFIVGMLIFVGGCLWLAWETWKLADPTTNVPVRRRFINEFEERRCQPRPRS